MHPSLRLPPSAHPIPSDIKAPIILQVSQGGSAYFAGKGLANDKQQASITGAVAAAHHIRTVAKAYGVYVPPRVSPHLPALTLIPAAP